MQNLLYFLQTYNDVAEDMRSDEETKSELHQQVDVSLFEKITAFIIVLFFAVMSSIHIIA